MHRTPIVLSPYSANWPVVFEEETRRLTAVFAAADVRIEHIGSTSVPGLGAKPIIDIMLGAETLSVIEASVGTLEASDYEYMPAHEAAFPDRRFFAKPKNRPRTVHLHAVEKGGAFWLEHLAFRDALRRDAALASQYFTLKLDLAERCGDDRELYTEGKGPFVPAVLSSLGSST
jgi:GrpB-like predicted nucleotidyltransferase (UPF0157 family)